LRYFTAVSCLQGRGRATRGPLGALFAALAIALLFAGCGETVIDVTKTEEQLQSSLGKSLGEKVSSVDCPSDQKVEPGATFDCGVKLANGKTATVTLKIRDNEADLSVIKLTEGGGGSNE
jgi:hypothetical protein